jgi:ring-1,2-phenylacetyl-CoA epoxidase subunit PaaC
MKHELLNYTLCLADNASVMSHRLGEWCGHGPVLEQDIALTNTALDDIGQARSFYQYSAEQVNAMPAEEKKELFSDMMLNSKISAGEKIDEDDLAYLRDAWDYRNVLLVEQPNKDWAYTIARSFFYDAFMYLFYSGLKKSKDEQLAAIAEKSLKEVTYHLRWSSEWVIRLGDGTEESHTKMQVAVNDMWMYTGELFKITETDKEMVARGIGVDLSAIRQPWHAQIEKVLNEATLDMPADGWMQEGGKEGRHSEYLGYILAEMQFVQRTYPGLEW